MNLPELTRRVRKHLAEAGTGLHTDDDIAAQVCRSARDLARTYHLFKGVTTLQVEPDGNITAPANMAGLISVGAAGWDLPIVTPTQFASYPGTWTEPAYYFGEEYDTGGKILLYSVRHAGPIVLTYYKYMPDPTATTEAWGGKYPEYHDLIALHAAHQLQSLTGVSAAKDVTWMQRLEQRKDEFRGYLATARIGSSRMQFQTNTRFPSRSLR